MDQYIEVADGHYIMENKKVQVQIKMCDNNGNPFIVKLHNVILAPDRRDKLFLIITLMHLGHTCLFNKIFCTVYIGNIKKCGDSAK